MDTSTIIATVQQKFDLLGPLLTERLRRQWAASEALALPRGGITLVAAATGLYPPPRRAGPPRPPDRGPRPGGSPSPAQPPPRRRSPPRRGGRPDPAARLG